MLMHEDCVSKVTLIINIYNRSNSPQFEEQLRFCIRYRG